jgi:hypothetical protein
LWAGRQISARLRHKALLGIQLNGTFCSTIGIIIAYF